MRKYGGSADEVLAYAETVACSAWRCSRSSRPTKSSSRAPWPRRSSEALRRGGGARARRARRLAPEVARRVEEELRGLAMPHATFSIEVSAARRGLGRDWARAAPTRSSSCSAPTPACRRGRCARPPPAASCRAPCSPSAGIVTLGDDVETLIFDEVDTGIGGVTAAALGERLARLAERRQVLCITHLPQVAAFAERQFAIVKRERRRPPAPPRRWCGRWTARSASPSSAACSAPRPTTRRRGATPPACWPRRRPA